MQRWNVSPAPAGIQHTGTAWIPAYAGMTIVLRARYVSTPEGITRSSTTPRKSSDRYPCGKRA